MARPPRPDSLPREFAVFPLAGALLLPHGKLPLNIFERRYLAMVDDALASSRMIGMIQPDESRAAERAGPGLYRIGCLGRLSSFSETDDGRYLITLSGLSRFTVREELETRRGYRRVSAEFSSFPNDLEAQEAAGIDRAALLAALRGYFRTRGFDANWEAIEELADPALVAALSTVCPFEPPEKQALLEAPTDGDRAAVLLALLQMGAHGTDAGRHAS